MSVGMCRERRGEFRVDAELWCGGGAASLRNLSVVGGAVVASQRKAALRPEEAGVPGAFGRSATPGSPRVGALSCGRETYAWVVPRPAKGSACGRRRGRVGVTLSCARYSPALCGVAFHALAARFTRIDSLTRSSLAGFASVLARDFCWCGTQFGGRVSGLLQRRRRVELPEDSQSRERLTLPTSCPVPRDPMAVNAGARL
jgi:hypothetical protein